MTSTSLTMYCGDTVSLEITWLDADGNPVNLTGASLVWALGRTPAGPLLVEKTVGQGIVITGASTGEFRIDIEPADTTNLKPGTYYHVCRAKEADGTVSTVLDGHIQIQQSLVAAPA